MWETLARIAIVYVCVMVIAASIAYLANQLGRQIGKRKMSVLHLRPRHTSILITTVTGALIAVITLTVFAFLSEPVRGLLGGVEKLRQEEAQLRQRVAVLSQTLEEGSFVWKVDEPIVHMTIPSGLPTDRTRAALSSLLAEANSKTILKNNEIAVAKGEQPLRADQVIIDFDPEMLERLASRLSFGQGVMGLRVLAQRNCLYRQKAPVAMEAWQVQLVFSAGATVAHQDMNPNEPLRDFFRFVENTRQAAIKKGMRPIGGELGGGLSSEEFDGLQEQMRQQEGPFELVAVANRDLYETSSLDIHIEVRPLPQDGLEEPWPSY